MATIEELEARLDKALLKSDEEPKHTRLIAEVKKLQDDFTALVNDYNTKADKIMHINYTHYTPEGKQNAQKIERDILRDAILQKLNTLDTKAVKKAAEVKQALNTARYPLNNSKDMNERLQGEMQINSALLVSQDADLHKIKSLIAHGTYLNKMDYTSALIDNFINKIGKDVVVSDNTININPSLDNMKDVAEQQKIYDEINDYRLGIKFLDTTIAALTLLNKDIRFLMNQTGIFLKVLNELGFIGYYTTGFDLEAKNLTMDGIINLNSDLYKILKFYPNNGQNFIEAFVKKGYDTTLDGLK